MKASFRVPRGAALKGAAMQRRVVVTTPRRVGVFQKAPDGGVRPAPEMWPRRYCPPRAGDSLAAGLDGWAPPPRGALEDRVEAIEEAVRPELLGGASCNVITFRNNLNKLMATPYEREPWQMGVRVDGGGTVRLEMEEYDGPRDPDARPPMDEARARRFQYFGRKFEALATGDGTGAAGAADETVVCDHLRFGAQHVLLGAEVDAWTSKAEATRAFRLRSADAPAAAPAAQPSDTLVADGDRVLVELKTARQPGSSRAHASFQRHKLLKWWIQSFLAGVPRVVAAFRDDEGRITSLAAYSTLRIPGLARDGFSTPGRDHRAVPAEERQGWDAGVCLSFTDDLLAWLRAEASRLPANAPLRLRFAPPYDRVELLEAEAEAEADQ